MNLTKLLLSCALSLSMMGQIYTPVYANEIYTEEESEGLTLSTDTTEVEIDLSKRNTVDVEFTITGPTLTGYNFGWSSSNSSVASIAQKGNMVNRKWTLTITAKGIGKNTCSVFIKNTTTEEIVSQVDIPVTIIDSSVTGLVLSETELTLAKGQPKTLTVKNSSTENIQWTSSDTSIATVDGNGKVIAKKEGTAIITASTPSGLTGSCTVIVRKPVVTLSTSLQEVVIDTAKSDSETVKISLNGDLYSTFNINLSSDTNAVFPEFQGSWVNAQRELKLEARALGEGKITIVFSDGETKEILDKLVIPVKVINSQTNPISINKTELSLSKGKAETLTAIVNSNDSVTWSSSDESVATVEFGKVTAISEGTATITATNKAGVSATCIVTVSEPKVSLIPSKNDVTIHLDGEKVENLSIRYEGELFVAADMKFTPSSDFISVDSDTQWNNQSLNMSITGKRAGTGDVLVTIKEKETGKLLAQTTIHVTVLDSNGSDISLNKSEITLVRGKSATISALTNEKPLTWNSSDASVAIVNDGTITAIKSGTAHIRVTAPSGSWAECMVTVIEPNVSLHADPDKISLDLGINESKVIEISCIGDLPKDYDLKINPSSKFVDVTIHSGMENQKFSINVEPKAVGTGNVTIKFLEKETTNVLDELEIPITVTDSRNIEVQEISLSENTLDMVMGTSSTLKVNFQPSNASDQKIIWSTSDEKVASVIDGKVSAISPGKAIITATTSNGKTAQCEVNVLDLNARVEGYSLSLSGNIGVNFYMALSQDVKNNPDAYMKFTSPNGEVSTILVKDSTPKDGYYVFPCFVSAKDMTGIIKAELYVGSRRICQYTYTVEEYAKYLINHASEFDANSVSIAKAMMTYGYYSQEYFKYKTDQLPETINSLENIDLSNNALTLIDNNDSLEFIGASLVLKSKTGIKLYFLGNGTFKVDGKDVQTTQEQGYTVVTISDINSYDKEYTITSENFTLKYSVYSYGQKALTTSSESLKNLIKALHAYNTYFR